MWVARARERVDVVRLLDDLDAADEEVARLRNAAALAKVALAHDAPGSCWATGPMTGDIIEDLVVCPGCKALHHIDAALANR